MRVADQDVVLVVEETVIVDRIGRLVESLVEDEGVDVGLTSKDDVVAGDLLRGQFGDTVEDDIISKSGHSDQAISNSNLLLTLLPKSPRAEPPLVPSCPTEARRIDTAQQLVATRRHGLQESGPPMFGRYL